MPLFLNIYNIYGIKFLNYSIYIMGAVIIKNSRAATGKPVFEIMRAVIIGSVTGAALCAVLLALFALAFVSAENIPQGFLSPFIIAVSVLCSFAAGLIAGKISKKRGLIYGALAGLVLFILFLISGLIVSQEAFTAVSGVRMLVMVISGAIGGLVSVSKKSKRK